MSFYLWHACADGDIEAARNAILHGADVDFEYWGTTCLGKAVYRGHLKIIELLVNHGANINKPDDFSYNAFRYAVANECKSTFALLLYYGADISSAPYINGHTNREARRILKILEYCRDDQSSLFSLLPPELIKDIQMNILEEEKEHNFWYTMRV